MIASALLLRPRIGTVHLFQDGFVGAENGFVENQEITRHWRQRRRALP